MGSHYSTVIIGGNNGWSGFNFLSNTLYSNIHFKDLFIYCIRLLCLHVWLCTMCVPGGEGVQKLLRSPWDCSYRRLQAIMRVLGIKPRSLRGADGALTTESSLQSFKTQFFDVKTFWIWNSSWKEYFYLSRHFKHSYMAVDTIQGLAVFTALSPGLETTSQCPCRAAPTRCISSSKGVPHPLLPPNRQLYTWIISFHSHFSWS